jgi:hypothetical protein
VTYAELKTQLENLHPDRLQDDVTIYLEDEDEYFAVTRTYFCNDGVLDDGHFYLALTDVIE